MRSGCLLFTAVFVFRNFICLAAEPSAFQQFVQARALDDDLDSVHLVWEWTETREGREDSPPLAFRADEKTVFRDGFVAESQVMRRVDVSGPRPMMLLSYFKDGHIYSRSGSLRHSRKTRHEVGPVPAGINPERKGVLRTPLEERFVAGQRRSGDVLHFTMNARELNAHLEETSAAMVHWEEAAVEVDLSGDGRIRKITSSGKFTRTSDAGTTSHRYRGTLEVLRRGGITISFPSDLETYEESK